MWKGGTEGWYAVYLGELWEASGYLPASDIKTMIWTNIIVPLNPISHLLSPTIFKFFFLKQSLNSHHFISSYTSYPTHTPKPLPTTSILTKNTTQTPPPPPSSSWPQTPSKTPLSPSLSSYSHPPKPSPAPPAFSPHPRRQRGRTIPRVARGGSYTKVSESEFEIELEIAPVQQEGRTPPAAKRYVYAPAHCESGDERDRRRKTNSTSGSPSLFRMPLTR